MILNKEVEIKLSSSNIKHYKDIGYILPDKPSGKVIIVNIDHISNSSWVKINALCYYCGSVKEIEFYRYRIIVSKNSNFSCSNKCSVAKRKETQLCRYGVDNYRKTDVCKERVKKTNLEKYGVINVFQSDAIKNSIKKTNLEKYGVNNISKSEEYHSNTIIGKDNNYLKYLGNYTSLFKCDHNFNHNFEITSDAYHFRVNNNTPLCTVCNPIGDSKSIKEKVLYEYIKNIYSGDVISGYRDGLEIDIYLPELKLGFEFNGLYHHSNKFKVNKNYHLDKTNHFKDRGIRIIHIWEDDYSNRLDIVRSQIKNLIGLSDEKIFARKCIIKILDRKISTKFLNDNHIQGKVNSSIKLGLYFNDELVSIMTFDSFEGRKKMEDGGWNLNRFCNKINTNVIGSASKLLSYFIKIYNPTRIVSYADKDWSIGNLYYTLGFDKKSESKPDYKYIVNKKRVHKSRYKKSKLNTMLTESKQMEINGINKVYDCGKIKFEKVIVTFSND